MPEGTCEPGSTKHGVGRSSGAQSALRLLSGGKWRKAPPRGSSPRASAFPPYNGTRRMPSLLRQREIIDRRALGDELARTVAEASAPATDRAVLLPPLKAALARGRDEIRRRFEAGGAGPRAGAAQSFLIDQLIRVIFDLAVETAYPLANPTEGEKMAIVAVGGYGRGELAPYSD